MGELLNREVQNSLLTMLADSYPQTVDFNRLNHWEDNSALVNLSYLAGHGLVEINEFDAINGRQIIDAVVTARGLDFLQDDGGLGAILQVVTVKLDDEYLRKLIIEKIEDSDVERGLKDQLMEKLQDLPGEAFDELYKRLLAAGLDNLPDLASMIKDLLN